MSDDVERDEEQASGQFTEAEQAAYDKAEDEIMDLFLVDQDKKPRQLSLLFTLLVFIVLFLVTLPEGEQLAFENEVVFVPDLETFIPPMKEPPPKKVQELEKIKKVALPDPTPEEPEPVREPIPEPEPEPLPPNVKVMRGLPRGPPRRGGPVREGTAGLTNPKPIKDVQPDYPTLARRANVGGQVIIRAVISKQGTVQNAELLKGIGRFGMDEAALAAVKQRTYEPGVLEGKPVAVIMTIRVNYILKQ